MGRRLGGWKWPAGGVAQRQGMAGGWTEQSQGEKSSRPCLKARRASGLSSGSSTCWQGGCEKAPHCSGRVLGCCRVEAECRGGELYLVWQN